MSGALDALLALFGTQQRRQATMEGDSIDKAARTMACYRGCLVVTKPLLAGESIVAARRRTREPQNLPGR
jgi:hypothetical protein